MIESNYSVEENIIYVKRIGDIELHEILNNIKKIDENFQGMKYLNILEDVTDSTTLYKVDDHDVIIEEINHRISNYKEVRCAVLVGKPTNTALSLLYEMISSNIENYKYKTFSTKEAAISWLKK